MTSEQLSVQRKVWILDIEKALTPHFPFKKFSTDYDDTITVNFGELSAGTWQAVIRVSSTVGKQNRVLLNGNPFSSVGGPACAAALVSDILQIKLAHEAKAKSAREQEEQAAQWLERQRRDLAGLPEIPGITLNIITSGTRSGDYEMVFEAGHPLETASLKQVKEFFKFLSKDKSKSSI